MRPSARPLAALVVAVAATATAAAAREPVAAPAADDLPGLAARLAETLSDRTVRLPDGSDAGLIAHTDGAAPLSAERLEACLRTVGEAEAWPSAWLVVQVLEMSWDVVLPVRLGDDGEIADPDPVLAVERREWTVDELRSVLREATGRKPRGRTWNLVIQTFTRHVVERFVYEPPKERGGLMALLPEGDLLREARSVSLGGDGRHTVAVVLREAELVPSACDSCDARGRGHADTGRIVVVLTDETELLDELEITSRLASGGGAPLLPRFRCRPGDDARPESAPPPSERFAERRPVPLITIEDDRADRAAVEIAIATATGECGRGEPVIVAVDREARTLRLSGE